MERRHGSWDTRVVGRLWAITSYFNPVGYRSRLANYKTFRAALEVPLLTVEWSTDGRFDLGSADADILIQRTSPDLLWQKERLVNVGLQALPADADLVAWLDCDVVFRRSDWWAAAARELETQPLAQLFTTCTFPGPAAFAEAAAPVESAASLAHLSRQEATGPADAQRLWGPPTPASPRRDRLAGLAWAGRREFVERHLLYDACVFGAGDRALACAAFGQHRTAAQAWLRTAAQRRHYFAWADPFAAEVAGRVGVVDGPLEHLWHGHLEDRQHRVRHVAAERHDFDPGADIAIDAATGLWRWASAKPLLHQSLAGFFERRREDAASG